MIEFALITPLLLLCIFGVIDMGRLFLVQSMMTNGAREGVRMASLNELGFVDSRAKASMPGIDALADSTAVVSTAPCPGVDNTTTVTITISGFDWLALGAITGVFPGGSLDAPDPLTASASMRCSG